MKRKIKWPHVGNTHITEYLERLINNSENEKDLLSGVYVFAGPDNLGKKTIADHFSKILICQDGSENLPCGKCAVCQVSQEKGVLLKYSDYHLVSKKKDKKNISVEQVREFIRALNMSSFLNSYKIGVMKNADTLSLEASNALLKTLEESKRQVVIILIVNDIESLPLTIASRAKVFNFQMVDSDKIFNYLVEKYGAKRDDAVIYSRICFGRPALAVKLFEDREFCKRYMSQAKMMLDFFSLNINERIKLLDGVLDKKKSAQENVLIAKRILEVWEGVVRDLYLASSNNSTLIQYRVFEDRIMKIIGRVNVGKMVNILNILKRAKLLLRSNVSPITVFEGVVIEI